MDKLEKNDIGLRLNNIFNDRFNIDLFDSSLNISIDDNLFGKKFNLRARDIIYLLYDVEKEFDILVNEDDIDNIKFNTIGNIIKIINKELNNKEEISNAGCCNNR